MAQTLSSFQFITPRNHGSSTHQKDVLKSCTEFLLMEMPALSNREQVKYSMISYHVTSNDPKAKTYTDISYSQVSYRCNVWLVAGFVK